MERFELYGWLTRFFTSERVESKFPDSDRLWLLPWHVPPIPKSALHFDRAIRSANNGTIRHCF